MYSNGLVLFMIVNDDRVALGPSGQSRCLLPSDFSACNCIRMISVDEEVLEMIADVSHIIRSATNLLFLRFRFKLLRFFGVFQWFLIHNSTLLPSTLFFFPETFDAFEFDSGHRSKLALRKDFQEILKILNTL